MDIKLIWAMDQKGGIGINGSLPWSYPDDLKHFKKLTLGHPCLMGRKTWEALPIKPLPGRTNLILSKTLSPGDLPCGVIHVSHFSEAISFLKDEEVLFIIGGAQIYQLFLPLATHLEVTKIGRNFECDTTFPSLDWSEWDFVESVVSGDLTFCSYENLK